MGGTIEISDVGMTVNMAGGRKIVFGLLGDSRAMSTKPLPPLTPEEEIYGRELCLLPVGWEELSGDKLWQNHLSDVLRKQWAALNREQKMAIAYSISELADELLDSQYSQTWQ